MTHEAGHALGLYHTGIGSNDALADTPVCINHPTCDGSGFTDSGFRNFMFGGGVNISLEETPEITGGQGYVMRMNPLTYSQ